jgi:histidine triad (HIT) family protein
MSYSYDDQNIFAKILRGEIPNKTVLETEYALAFEDIAPQAPDSRIGHSKRILYEL